MAVGSQSNSHNNLLQCKPRSTVATVPLSLTCRKPLPSRPRSTNEEIHCLRGKMAISERTAKAEAQIKERLRLRLSTLEEGLKHSSGLSIKHAKNSEKGSRILSQSQEPRKKSTFQARTSHPANMAFILQKNQSKSVEILARNNLSSPSDYNEKRNAKVRIESSELVNNVTPREMPVSEIDTNTCSDVESQMNGGQGYDFNDTVSGFLYDQLQKQVINLRKSLEQKDVLLKAKDGESKKLLKKVDTLTKAMEQQSKTMRREAMARKKERILVQPELRSIIQAHNVGVISDSYLHP